MTPSPEYLTTAETAAFVGVTQEAVFQRIKAGKMSGAQQYGRTIVLRKDAVVWQRERHKRALIMLGEMKK